MELSIYEIIRKQKLLREKSWKLVRKTCGFLINNTKLNVGFGYGGPLNICQAFSKNNAFYIDKLQHVVLNDYKRINNNVYDDIQLFIDKLNLYV